MFDPIPFPEPTLIPIHEVELEVFEAGRHNAGKPIVLCHGWPEHAYSWRYQVPALVEAGYHVIIPNQRGYGNSSCPDEVSAYDLEHLAGDLVALLGHYGYDKATFVGHDWGAMVVWGLALLHPDHVERLVALSVPYQPRGDKPWLAFLEELFGSDYYFVHFHRHPGVADAVFETDPQRFLRNLFRKNTPPAEPGPGNVMMHIAQAEAPLGDPVMSEQELAVFVEAFTRSGFSGGVNWYRNLDRNWHRLAEVDPVIRQPALMVYGAKDAVPPSPVLADFVPQVVVRVLDCGHWIQQELPEATNRTLLDWLERP